LLSDFGGRDGYVAAMKGVIAALAPRARIIDAAHDVPPQDVQAAAWTLMQYWSLYPEGTIHVAVVDPGVGTSRKALCVEADGRFLIAPDNGIVSLAMEVAGRDAKAFEIRPEVHRPGVLSATFHGRDVFAYAAGLLAAGSKTVSEIADPLAQVVKPSWTRAISSATRIEGEVIYVDHFGNLVTNIFRTQMGDADWSIASVRVGAQLATRICRTYADVPGGTVLALFNSSDTLEIAVNGSSAHTRLACGRGTKIHVEKGILGRGLVTA
jgi:S-adenosylmethionine hydrolase